MPAEVLTTDLMSGQGAALFSLLQRSTSTTACPRLARISERLPLRVRRRDLVVWAGKPQLLSCGVARRPAVVPCFFFQFCCCTDEWRGGVSHYIALLCIFLSWMPWLRGSHARRQCSEGLRH
ncbi:hypothetical protein NDU88_007086 [Pleurodeles waltl]|uniref:Uncharacterized protein n=1 Tax=Pleurodeles waltl TaxID=8319 RepID=A0AAV7QQJ0_PLEWA|nr:hypothetical protein NDU88_007086 [Pleurodeles waltl]